MKDDTSLYLLQGISHCDSQQWKQAQIALEKALEVNPDDWVALVYLLLVFMQMNDKEREETVLERMADLDAEMLQKVWERHADDPGLWFVYAHVLKRRGDWARAAAVYQRRTEVAPADKWAYYQLGFACSKLQDWERAERALDQALNIDPQYMEALKHQAYVASQKGDLKQSVDLHQRYLAVEPHDEVARFNLAMDYYELQDWERAKRALDQVLTIDPAHEYALYYRAYTVARQGNFEQAVEFFRRYLALNPQDKDENVHLDLADALKEIGRLEEAEREYEAAAAFPSTAAEALHKLVCRAFERQDWTCGRQWAERLVQVAPDYPDSYYMLGRFCAEWGDLKRAEEYLRRELSRSPDNVDCRADLCMVLVQTERWTEAEAQVREALRYAPNNADLYARLSYVLEGQDRLEEAEAATRQALELDPNDEHAQQMLDWIWERRETSA